MSSRARKVERNAICSRCGKKIKFCQCHSPAKKNIIYLLIIVMALAGVIGARMLMKSDETNEVLHKETTTSSIKQVMISHGNHYESMAGNQGQLSWFLEEAPIPENPNSFIAANKVLSTYKEKVAIVFKQYRHFSPFVEEVIRAFAKPFFSIYTNGATIIPFLTKEEMETGPSGDLEICLIPKKEFTNIHPARLYYKREWGAVMLMAAEIPMTIFPGLLLHEMGHAYLHKVKNAPSAFAPKNSDLYVGEEVQMYDMEAEIMNAASGGKYYKAADQILADMSGAGSFLEILKKVNIVQLLLMDKALGLPPCSAGVINILTPQHYYVLGSRFIKKSASLKKKDDKKRLYRAISSVLM